MLQEGDERWTITPGLPEPLRLVLSMDFAEESDDAARAKGVGEMREEFAGYIQ